MKVLTRDEILGVQDIQIEKVTVPEWGGVVCVKMMNGEERDRFEMTIVGEKGKKNIRARVCSMAVCDENGNSLFSEADIEALGKKSVKALDLVFETAMKLNRMGKSDIEEMEKNSVAVDSDIS